MEDTLARRIGRQLAKLRRARGWNQEEFARACDKTRGYISDVELGRYGNLGIDTLEELCIALSLSVKEFFDSMPGA